VLDEVETLGLLFLGYAQPDHGIELINAAPLPGRSSGTS
jgi:hypothetical protein